MADTDRNKIQERTFTKWFNNFLAIDSQITNLQTDLKDGLKLVELLEILTSKKFEGINKQPTNKIQELENLTIVFEYLKNEAKVKKVDMIGKL